jgi:hypothetical protein
MVGKITKEKYDTLNRLLEEEYTLIHLDPEIEGVALPQHLKETPTVTLKVSRFFRGTLTVEAERVVADLLFGANYFTCVIPFEAVWGLTSAAGSNVMWPDNTPLQVREKLVQPQPPPSKVGDSAESGEKKRAHLRRVK